MRSFYLVMMIAGTLVPWLFFGRFVADNGLDLPGFVAGLFANGAAGGFSSDVVISALVFWVWSYGDARRNGITRWWLVLPATALVGLSLSLPFYLWMREGETRAATQPA